MLGIEKLLTKFNINFIIRLQFYVFDFYLSYKIQSTYKGTTLKNSQNNTTIRKKLNIREFQFAYIFLSLYTYVCI